jgi:uncharacterized protein YegJ (DUF2314 family)
MQTKATIVNQIDRSFNRFLLWIYFLAAEQYTDVNSSAKKVKQINNIDFYWSTKYNSYNTIIGVINVGAHPLTNIQNINTICLNKTISRWLTFVGWIWWNISIFMAKHITDGTITILIKG